MQGQLLAISCGNKTILLPWRCTQLRLCRPLCRLPTTHFQPAQTFSLGGCEGALSSSDRPTPMLDELHQPFRGWVGPPDYRRNSREFWHQAHPPNSTPPLFRWKLPTGGSAGCRLIRRWYGRRGVNSQAAQYDICEKEGSQRKVQPNLCPCVGGLW